jgi:hypothetical protein
MAPAPGSEKGGYGSFEVYYLLKRENSAWIGAFKLGARHQVIKQKDDQQSDK